MAIFLDKWINRSLNSMKGLIFQNKGFLKIFASLRHLLCRETVQHLRGCHFLVPHIHRANFRPRQEASESK